MRRMWVLIASVLACAIITTTPATAQPAAQPAVQPAATVAAATTPAAPVQGSGPVAARAPMNWFSDWQTCIWGIGAPAGIIYAAPATGKWWVRAYKWGLLNRYSSHVRNACIRFIHS